MWIFRFNNWGYVSKYRKSALPRIGLELYWKRYSYFVCSPLHLSCSVHQTFRPKYCGTTSSEIQFVFFPGLQAKRFSRQQRWQLLRWGYGWWGWCWRHSMFIPSMLFSRFFQRHLTETVSQFGFVPYTLLGCYIPRVIFSQSVRVSKEISKCV